MKSEAMATSASNTVTDSVSSSIPFVTEETHETDNIADMDRFLERAKTDLMYELRNIEHGRRPVTGQSNRERLQQFMEKHGVGVKDFSTTSGESSGKEMNIPANVDSVEKHRPEAVVVEVQAVVELRPVSSALQSAAFRRHLENIIRGSLTSQPPVNITAGYNRGFPRAVASSGTSSIPDGTQTPEIRPQLMRQISTESNDSFSSARSSYEQVEEINFSSERAADTALPGSEGIPRTVNPQRQERAVIEQQDPSNQNITWNDITSLQREQIVEEISELLHSQLVTSTLGGEFRTALEMIAQNHISSSGTNGRAVQDFINSLPRTGVQRNDFSQLGIPQAQQNDNWDNISVTSVSAHSVPYAQSNSYLAREIHSLRSQMNEMKNMLRLTFDLQVDIQRAIRQEVAAAINNVPGATGVSPSMPGSVQPVEDSHCLICLERHTDTVLYQCGHMCVCFACGRDLVSRGHRCPVCRAPIKDVIRTYRTNAD
ncbi:unnamed protein product [Candidula unifasciata]|uniref:RING-type domain-containing protein n=1 Tax=Candidula unifasciata TaxID=100452 RepID=A0A8S3ZNP3_9EUPU|nr:unnamed protein product [Candidula unifasciata]